MSSLSILKKKSVIIPLVIVTVVGGIVFLNKKSDDIATKTEKATLEDISEVVSVDGTVESDSKIDLRFQKAGEIAQVNVEEGDNIKKNNVLMELENRSAEIELSRAQSVLNIARANLNLKYAGPSSESRKLAEIAIKEVETNLANAVKKLVDIKLSDEEALKSAELNLKTAENVAENMQKAYDNYKESGVTSNTSAEQTLEGLYDSANPAVLDSLDILRTSISKVDTIKDDYSDTVLSYFKKDYRYKMENELDLSVENLKNSEDTYNNIKDEWKTEDVDSLLVNMIASLETVKSMLDNTYNALENSRTTTYFTDDKIKALQADISNQQTLLIAKLNNIQTINQHIIDAKLGITSTELSTDTSLINAKTNLDNALNALEIAKSKLEQVKIQNSLNESDAQMNIDVLKVKLEQAKANYDKLVAKPRNVDIAALSAQVDQANAGYAQALKNLEDNQILAPVDGVVTDVKLDVGENANQNEIAVVMMVKDLNIVANIPESDIAEVTVGDKVDIILDAFNDSDKFKGTIISINPAETVIQGVIYYEAKIIIDKPDRGSENKMYEKIRSGMTADIEIAFKSKNNAITVPKNAIYRENSDTYVYVKNKIGGDEKRIVKIGISGVDRVEILDGIKVGEEVIIK